MILQKSDIHEDTVFEQENFYYFCEVECGQSEQHLDEYEAEEGFVLRYVTPQEAIRVNQLNSIPEHSVMLERENGVLKLLCDM